MDTKKILSDNRTSQATIGLTEHEFQLLVPWFEKIMVAKRRERHNPFQRGRPGILQDVRDKLFFVLYYLKTYPTFDVLSVTFGMHRSNACRWVHYYVSVLIEALERSGALPRRAFRDTDEFIEAFPGLKLIIIDATERRKRRPKDSKMQKEYYSGKKNAIQ